MTDVSSPRLIIPALGKIYTTLADVASVILRVGMGAILIPHGLQKLFGWFQGPGIANFAKIMDQVGYQPGILWTYVIALTETVGGFLLLIGLFTRPAALAIFIFMINAVHFTSQKGFFWTKGGSEYSLLILLVATFFVIRGGGAWSADRAMGREF